MAETKYLNQQGLQHLAEILKRKQPCAFAQIVAEGTLTPGSSSSDTGNVVYIVSQGKIALQSNGSYYSCWSKNSSHADRTLYCDENNSPYVGKLYSCLEGGLFIGSATGLTEIANKEDASSDTSEAMTNDEIDALFDF